MSPSYGPMLSELRQLFPSFEKRTMIGLLCVLSIGVLGISPGSRIPLEEAKRVLDAEALTDTVGDMWDSPASIIQLKLFHMKERKKYALRGYVHALVIWMYESIPV